MTTDERTITSDDLDRLRDLFDEMLDAGREREAESITHAYFTLLDLLYPDPTNGLPDDDPELAEMLDAAERDIESGNLIPHEEVLRRLKALDDG